MFRAATKISSCQVFAVTFLDGRQLKQLGWSLFPIIFLLFPLKVAWGLAHSSQGRPQPMGLSDSPEVQKHRRILAFESISYDCFHVFNKINSKAS